MDVSAALTVVAVGVAVAATIVALASRRATASARAELASMQAATDDRARRAEAASGRLADALRALDEGIVIVDERGDTLLRNPSAAEMLDEPVGGSLVAAAIARLVQQAAGGGPSSETLELFGPPRRTIKVAASPVMSGGVAAGVVVVLDDLTERRRLEAVRRDFVANISHELKTPIGALGLLAETLLDEPDPQVVHRLASRMQLEAIRVGRTIEDLLDLSRIESEESPVRQPIVVQPVLHEASERLREAATRRGIDLGVVDDADTLTVLGDRRQLVSAVHSLVENAISYTDPGGRVRVAATRVGDRVSISVADTGVGIPARDLDRIFERFYRVDRARARATGGTGLGLSIVRNVAHNHGGEVLVESQEGVGSTFRLVLPAGPAFPMLDEAG